MPASVGYLVIDNHTRELEGFRWRQMAGPEGNEFDLDVPPPG